MTTLDSKSPESNFNKMNDSPSEKFVVCVRGLPRSTTAKGVAEFFSGCNIHRIHFTYNGKGRHRGECCVELVSLKDMKNALAKSNNSLGKRYVEVFESEAGEMERTCKRIGQPQDTGNEAVVRLRGLPSKVSKEEIAQFFTGLEIVPNGITITLDEDGWTTGEAFVEFASPELASQAMKKNKESIRRRKIKIFKSSKANIKYVSKAKRKRLMPTRPGPYDRQPGPYDGRRFRGRGGHTVHMRGLPFTAKENDVKQFFMPIKPVNIRMEYSEGSFSGQVNVDFASHEDAQAAVLKNSHRDIELFLCSKPDTEVVPVRGWAASESGGQSFGRGNSGGDKFDSENFGSGNFGGNFNAEDNYKNFGGARSSFGGNQTNSGGFGGQANQSSGFNSPQPQQQQQQQQQSNFSNQMGVGGGGGSFGNQGNSFSSNAGAFNAGPSPGGGNYSAQSSYGQTTGFSGSGFGGQMSSGLSTGMTTGHHKDSVTVGTHVQTPTNVWCVIM